MVVLSHPAKRALAGEAIHLHLRRQRCGVETADANELDFKFRRAVAIRIAGQYAGGEAQLAGLRKSRVSDEGEGLVAR
jgi:hypothetical protein